MSRRWSRRVAHSSGASTSCSTDRKSTRLNSSHTVIYTLSLHDALPICGIVKTYTCDVTASHDVAAMVQACRAQFGRIDILLNRSEEHTSELQSHRDLHSFPTRRSSDLRHRQDVHMRRNGVARCRGDGPGVSRTVRAHRHPAQ